MRPVVGPLVSSLLAGCCCGGGGSSFPIPDLRPPSLVRAEPLAREGRTGEAVVVLQPPARDPRRLPPRPLERRP